MMEEVRVHFDGSFDAVAYSARPRPVDGSYMPVFLAGEGFARSMASALQVPVKSFSHQEGHIEAIKAYSPWSHEEEFLACHFSGGTCEVLQVRTLPKGQAVYGINQIGGSKDISFGQVLDRMGVQLGYDFPAGEAMDQAALSATDSTQLLTPIKVKDAQLNLSGIDTQIKNLLEKNGENIASGQFDVNGLIREFFEKMTKAMAKMLVQAAERSGKDKILMAGGVASSRFLQVHLQDQLKKSGLKLFFDANGLSQDNAVGIALLGGGCLWD